MDKKLIEIKTEEYISILPFIPLTTIELFKIYRTFQSFIHYLHEKYPNFSDNDHRAYRELKDLIVFRAAYITNQNVNTLNITTDTHTIDTLLEKASIGASETNVIFNVLYFPFRTLSDATNPSNPPNWDIIDARISHTLSLLREVQANSYRIRTSKSSEFLHRQQEGIEKLKKYNIKLEPYAKDQKLTKILKDIEIKIANSESRRNVSTQSSEGRCYIKVNIPQNTISLLNPDQSIIENTQPLHCKKRSGKNTKAYSLLMYIHTFGKSSTGITKASIYKDLPSINDSTKLKTTVQEIYRHHEIKTSIFREHFIDIRQDPIKISCGLKIVRE